MKKATALLLLLSCAAGSWADVGVVRIFDPQPGRANDLYAAGAKAEAIQEKLGAIVDVWIDQTGSMHHVMSFANWEAWATFGTALEASNEWTAFIQGFAGNPPGTPDGVIFLNTPVVAVSKPVALVYSWNVMPGKTGAFIANAQEAAAIHQKLGASVGINIDDLGDVHYEMQFDSWAAWAKYTTAIQQSKEWEAFITKANQNPMAELVNVLRLTKNQAPM